MRLFQKREGSAHAEQGQAAETRYVSPQGDRNSLRMLSIEAELSLDHDLHGDVLALDHPMATSFGWQTERFQYRQLQRRLHGVEQLIRADVVERNTKCAMDSL